MDVDVIRTVLTVVSFLTFLGICFWAFSSRQKERFEEAAHLPFDDDDMQQQTLTRDRYATNMTDRKPGGREHG